MCIRDSDNVIHDVALQGLHVVMCLDRAGLVGEDGATHHGVFDLAAMLPVPGLTIASPMDEVELRNLMFTAASGEGPFVIRYPRGNGVKMCIRDRFWSCWVRTLPARDCSKLPNGSPKR